MSIGLDTSSFQPRYQPRSHSTFEDIKWRRRGRKKGASFAPFVHRRKSEMIGLRRDRHGTALLANDDAGRDDLRIMAEHLAQLGEHYVRRHAEDYAPWISVRELDRLILEAGPEGKKWTAIRLGKALRLTNAERVKLGIRTIRPIDRTKAQLERDRRERDAERKRQMRARTGARPRAQSAETAKPWIAEGISRRTWYRRKSAVGTA
jgi:hypothetical protein